MMDTFVDVSRLTRLLRSSRSVVLNRLDEPDAMASAAPSETAK